MRDRRTQLYGNIRKQITSKHPRAAAVAAVSLTSLAHWYAQHGSLAILDHRIEGWADIDRVLHYFWWSLRIDTGTNLVPNAALVLAHAMAFEEETMADWLAERLILSLDDGTFLCWDEATFGAFILKLWMMHRGRTDIDATRSHVAPLGVYQRVLDTWSKPDQLRAALSAAADYHLAQSWTARGYPAFVLSPYQLFPVDMLAIARVRQDLGLEMPEVEHPLLATTLAALPPREQRPRMGSDPLLEQVIQKARDTGCLE